MKRLLIPALAMLAMVSCTKENEQMDSESSLIRLRAGIEVPIVKGAIGQDENGKLTEALSGVQFVRVDGETPAWTGVSEISFAGIIGIDGGITGIGDVHYPFDGSNANIVGYYPAATSIAAGVLKMTIDGTNDVIYAAPKSGNKTANASTPIAMTFVHKLTQFSFVVKREADIADVTGVNVTVKDANTTFDMPLADGKIANFATPVSTIKPIENLTANATGVKSSAPVMLEPGMATITLTVEGVGFGSREVTVTSKESTGKFEAGKHYTITLLFGGTDVTGNATIDQWQDGVNPDDQPIK